MSTDGTAVQDGLSDDWAQPAGGTQVDEQFDAEFAPIDLDLEGVDPDAFRGGNQFVDLTGKYHLEVENAEYKSDLKFFGNVKPGFRLKCCVLQSVAGQSPAGSIIMHDVEIPQPGDHERTTKKGAPFYPIILSALCHFLYVIYLLVKKEGKYIDASGGKFPMKSRADADALAEKMKGTQFIGCVERRGWTEDAFDESGNKITKDRINQKTGKPGASFELTGGISAVDDPANYGVPMNQAALAAIGKKQAVAPAASTAPAGNGKRKAAAPAAQTQTQQVAPAAVAAAPTEELDI
jgi:hypothetical protein